MMMTPLFQCFMVDHHLRGSSTLVANGGEIISRIVKVDNANKIQKAYRKADFYGSIM